MPFLTSSFSIVRATNDQADAWALDPAQLFIAALGFVAVPVAGVTIRPIGRLVLSHPWILLLVPLAMLLLAIVHTHVRIDSSGVVVRRRWLLLTLKTERLALGGRFEAPIQEQDRGQLYYSGAEGSSDGFAVARATNLQAWLNEHGARIKASHSGIS